MLDKSVIQSRSDLANLEVWYNVAKFFAFTPIKNHIYLSILYPSFLFLIFLGSTMFSFYERLFFIYTSFNISQAILDTLQGVTEFMFIEHVVIVSVVKRSLWEKLIKRIFQMEQQFNWTFFSDIKDSSKKSFYVCLIFCHFIYFTSHIFDTIANWETIYYSLAFIIFRFTTYYIMFSTLFITFVCTWIKNRYLYLKCLLKSSSPSRNLIKINLLQNEVIMQKLSEFSHTYKSLYLVVQEVNQIFGTYFLFIPICTVLEILNAVNYGMPTKKDNVKLAVLGDNIIYLVLYAVGEFEYLLMGKIIFSYDLQMCNIQIVMSCQRVLEANNQVWKTCLILHQEMKTPELRDEYLTLAYFVQGLYLIFEIFKLDQSVVGLSPQFSATGFWMVNQTNLSTLFSSVMTYLIIIIQFNMTLGK